jgi:hypothetical protein
MEQQHKEAIFKLVYFADSYIMDLNGQVISVEASAIAADKGLVLMIEPGVKVSVVKGGVGHGLTRQ